MPNYGDAKYWDERYARKDMCDTFDWLEGYSQLKEVLLKFLPKGNESKILVLGCGNAEFSEDMYDDGYKDITNVDISDVVIQKMKERNKESRPGMSWLQMDVTEMDPAFENTFDIAIDKSTIDALLCGEDSILMVAKMLKES